MSVNYNAERKPLPVGKDTDRLYAELVAPQLDDDVLAIYWTEFNHRASVKHGERVAERARTV